MLADPKSTKRLSSQAAFCAVGVCGIKAAHRMLMKLTPGFQIVKTVSTNTALITVTFFSSIT